jgi:hypothetical protein
MLGEEMENVHQLCLGSGPFPEQQQYYVFSRPLPFESTRSLPKVCLLPGLSTDGNMLTYFLLI